MIRHVPVIAWLQIVQGCLECLGGVVYAFIPNDAPNLSQEALFLFVFGIPLAIMCAGLLRIVAGALNLGYRGRRLGLVALFTGMASCITCYCMPMSACLLAYGCAVYLSPDVRRAFEIRASANAAG